MKEAVGAFLRKSFEIADSQYQLCPYFELNYQNLVSVGVQCLLSLVLSF